jgi:hypothetical protein
MPNNITIVHQGKDIGPKVEGKKRPREKPRKPFEKINITRNFIYDIVDVIIPSESVINEDAKKLECLYLFDPTMREEEFKWWWAGFAS